MANCSTNSTNKANLNYYVACQIHAFLEFLKIPEGIYIPFFGWRWYEFITMFENLLIRHVSIPENPINTADRENKIIVSLTSYPGRIETVYYAIKSLMRQTIKPDQIILWLAESQFPDRNIPNRLEDLKGFGLEIQFCKDLKSHKKYYYSLQEQKQNLVITYDDDIIYPPNSIELLVKKHIEFPNCIVCNRGFEIILDETKMPISVSDWKLITNEGIASPSLKIMPSTGGGCLYPPECLSEDVFNWDKIQRIALSADDLWMKAMSLLKGTHIIKTHKYSKTFSLIRKSQNEHLAHINTILGQNNIVVKNILNEYPCLFEKIISN